MKGRVVRVRVQFLRFLYRLPRLAAIRRFDNALACADRPSVFPRYESDAGEASTLKDSLPTATTFVAEPDPRLCHHPARRFFKEKQLVACIRGRNLRPRSPGIRRHDGNGFHPAFGE